MTYIQILKDLKEGKYKPIYLLMGDESYFIDKITDFIAQNALKESEKSFNQMIMYGKDTEVGTIDTTARRFPMMAERMVIIVKEAQNLKNIENLVYYAQKPQKSTVLVLNYKYKTIDKRKKVYKEIKKNGVILESKKLYENKIPPWIEAYLKEKNFLIDPISTKLLTDYLGNDLKKISNELDKLIISLPKNTKVLPKHIEENIGISKDYNNFELQNAIIRKDLLKANRIVNYFAKNQKNNPIVLTINSLYFFFSKVLMVLFIKNPDKFKVASVLKINPFFADDYIAATKKYGKNKVVEIISLLREYDLKSKGVGNSSVPAGSLLKELVSKIMF